MAFAHISQIDAAPYVLSSIRSFQDTHSNAPGLEAVYDTDVIALRRGLCLPAATCASLNGVYGYRKYGEPDIGHMYRDLLPLHGAKAIDPKTGEAYKFGWRVFTEEGDMYYHAISYWVKRATNEEVHVHSIVDYDNLSRLAQTVRDADCAVALSLDNRFVLDWVTQSQNELGTQFISHDQDGNVYFNGGKLGKKPFQNGRHVVSLLKAREDELLISDSFSLPGMTVDQTIRWWPTDQVAQYTKYHSGLPPRAIILTREQVTSPVAESFINRYEVPVSFPL